MYNGTTEHHENHVKILRYAWFQSNESVIFKFPSLQSIIMVLGNNKECHDLYIYPGMKARGQLRLLKCRWEGNFKACIKKYCEGVH